MDLTIYLPLNDIKTNFEYNFSGCGEGQHCDEFTVIKME